MNPGAGIPEHQSVRRQTKDAALTTFAHPPRAIGPMVLFAVVYLAALAIIFAPEGSLSSRAPTDLVTNAR
jgi:hypothetical protein